MDNKDNNLFEPTLVNKEENANNENKIDLANSSELKSLDEEVEKKKIDLDESIPEISNQEKPLDDSELNSTIESNIDNDKKNDDIINIKFNNGNNNPIKDEKDNDIINIKLNNNNNNFSQNENKSDMVSINHNMKTNNESTSAGNDSSLNNSANNENIGLNNSNTFNSDNYTQEKSGKSKIGKIIPAILLILIGAAVSYYFIFKKDNWTIVCTKSEQGISQEFTVEIKNSEYHSGKIKQTIDMEALAKQYGANLSDIDLSKLDMCDAVKSENTYMYKYNNCRQEINGSKITIYVDLDINMTNKHVDGIDDAKKTMQKDGYTCK